MHNECPGEDIRRQMVVALQQLFSGASLKVFVDEYLHRLPLALPDVAEGFRSWASWDTVGQLATTTGVDVLLVRDGETLRLEADGSLASLQNYCSGGWTIRMRNVQQHSEAIGGLAASFKETFRGSVNVHLYVTPSGHRGLGWHYDAEDVFILQTAGAKEYLLRKNTVHPWPLEETMPENLRYERELMPLSRVMLDAGDLLYIPCGYWHRTESPQGSAGAAISLAVGIMSPSAIDLLIPLRRKLAGSLAWRQRLPIGMEVNLENRLRLLLAQLADDCSRTLKSPELLSEIMKRYVDGS
jgi:50S ribosomal protein L16 3-hydroxylase